MRKLLISLLLSFLGITAQCQGAEWIELGQDDQFRLYLSPDRTNIEKGQLWAKYVPMKEDKEVRYFLTLHEYNCEEETGRVAYTVMVKRNGESRMMDTREEEMKPVIPNSIMERIYKIFCYVQKNAGNIED